MINQSTNDISILEKNIDEAATDAEKARAIADLAWRIKYSDPARAVELGDQAIELSRNADIETSLPKSYLSKAIGLLQMSRFEAAEGFGQKGLNSYRKLDNQAGVRHALNVIGSIYFRWGKYATALEHYLESLRIHMQLSDTPDPGILSNIGAVYLELGDTDRALECYKQVKRMSDKDDGPADLKTATCINMGEIYSRMGMYDDALECYKAGYEIGLENDMKQAIAVITDDIGTVMIELGRYGEAMKNFNESITLFRSLDDVKGEALVLSNIGKCFFTEGNGKAIEFYLKSLKKFRTLNDNQGIADVLIGISRVMTDLDRNDVALEKLGEALEVAQKVGLKPQLSEIHERLSTILENEGKFDTAYKHLKLYHELENVLRSERTANLLKSLKVIHQVEKAREETTKYILQNIELEEDRNKLEEIVRSRADELIEDSGEQECFIKTGKQLEVEPGIDRNFQMLTESVSRIAHDLNDVLTFAIEGVKQVLKDQVLSEKTKKDLRLAAASVRDAFPLIQQLISHCDSQNVEVEVSEITPDDVLKNESVSKLITGSKVLVVEDDPEVAEHLRTTLEENGYPVMISASLQKAREIIRESLEDLGCIIVDIVLDDGSGIDLIRDVHELKPEFPVLAGSSYPLSTGDMDYLKEGGITIVQKPYKIDNILLKLSTILPL